MRSICYLILAHNNLSYVAALIKSLADEDVGFILHVDIKCCEDIKQLTLKVDDYNITILKDRHDIVWGDKSMVDAVNNMCRAGLKHKDNYDYFILLSGQDMPLKSPNYIKNYIFSNGLRNCIQSSPMLTEECLWAERGRRRIECYAIRLRDRDIATIEPWTFNTGNLRQIVKTIARGNKFSFTKMLRILFSTKKRKGLGIKPYGGEFWWRLNRESLEIILKYYASHPELEEELEFTSNPDEIIYNSLVNHLCDDIDNSLHTFINWKKGSSPDWIEIDDQQLLDSLIKDPDMLFCRKVKNIDVLDYVSAKTTQLCH